MTPPFDCLEVWVGLARRSGAPGGEKNESKRKPVMETCTMKKYLHLVNLTI